MVGFLHARSCSKSLNCMLANSSMQNNNNIIINTIIKISARPHGLMENQGTGNKYITSHGLTHRHAEQKMHDL